MLNTDELWFNIAEFCPPTALNKCKPYLKEYAEGFSKFSPENHLSKWDDAPHLVVHGKNDFRLSWSEGNGLFTFLKMKNIPSQYLFLYEEGHSVTKNENRIFWSKTVNEFLNKNLN